MCLFLDANAYNNCSSSYLPLPSLKEFSAAADCFKSSDRLIPPLFLGGDSISCDNLGFSAMDNLCNPILLSFLIGEDVEDSEDVDRVVSILNQGTDGKWTPFFEATYLMRNNPTFDNVESQLKLLNRIAESETRWITPLLYALARNLLQICFTDPSPDKLSQCARTIHKSFNLCLNDRNPNPQDNRRVGCYSLTPLELKIYHRLQNRDMIKNLLRVLESRSNELHLFAPGAVAFHYYLAEHYAYEGKHQTSCKHLQLALSGCCYGSSQLWHILLLLIPQTMLCERRYCNFRNLQAICDETTYSKLTKYYKIPVQCFLDGNLAAFDSHLLLNELFFLRHNLYVCMLQLRELVFLRYCKLCWQYASRQPITRLDLFTRFVTSDSEHESRDHVECMLANLIAKGRIKGYLSHTNRCIVLSKRDPFPRMVKLCT